MEKGEGFLTLSDEVDARGRARDGSSSLDEFRRRLRLFDMGSLAPWAAARDAIEGEGERFKPAPRVCRARGACCPRQNPIRDLGASCGSTTGRSG